MAITYKKTVAMFADVVSIEEAEGLLQWALKHPQGKVNLAACTHLHAADLQVLLASRLPVSAWPRDAQLKAWLTSALQDSKETTHG